MCDLDLLLDPIFIPPALDKLMINAPTGSGAFILFFVADATQPYRGLGEWYSQAKGPRLGSDRQSGQSFDVALSYPTPVGHDLPLGTLRHGGFDGGATSRARWYERPEKIRKEAR